MAWVYGSGPYGNGLYGAYSSVSVSVTYSAQSALDLGLGYRLDLGVIYPAQSVLALDLRQYVGVSAIYPAQSALDLGLGEQYELDVVFAAQSVFAANIDVFPTDGARFDAHSEIYTPLGLRVDLGVDFTGQSGFEPSGFGFAIYAATVVSGQTALFAELSGPISTGVLFSGVSGLGAGLSIIDNWDDRICPVTPVWQRSHHMVALGAV